MTKDLDEPFLAVALKRRLSSFVDIGVLDDRYLRVEVKSYLDEDAERKLAVRVAYLQDWRAPIEELDSQVLDLVLQEVENSELDGVLNDITVNCLQWRNGAVLSHEK